MKAPSDPRMPGRAKAKAKAKGTSRASKPGKSATKSKSPPKAGAKAKPGASEAKPIKVRKGEKVAVVLSGGNPRIAAGSLRSPAATSLMRRSRSATRSAGPAYP